MDVNTGIWVDIFPYYPINLVNIGKRIKCLQLIAKAYLLKEGYKINAITPSRVSRAINTAILLSITLVPKATLRACNEKCLSDLYSEEHEMYLEIDGRFKGQPLFDNTIFDTFETAEFDDTTFSIPTEYDKYLKKVYVDYM